MSIDELLELSVVGSFTNVGHAVRSRRWSEDLPDMTGRTVVVTGATSGLGRAAAERLSALGARVVLVGRSPSKLTAVREELAGLPGETVAYTGDLSEMKSVRRVADEILAGEPEIHVLINNAGALFPERGESSEGIELTLATNLLGHFLLTNLLIPRLEQSAPARIINVSSGGMYTQRLRVRDLQSTRGDFKGSIAYARTKRGQVVLTELWSERLADRGIVVHAMHPGWADTPGVEKSLPFFRKITGPFLRTPEQGADTMVWLAASEEAGETSGLFWHDRSPRPTHRLKGTVEAHDDRWALWDALNELCGTDF